VLLIKSNQVQWSLLHRDPETVRCLGATDDRTLCEICADRGIQILAYSPLAQGLLTGRYRKGRLPSGVRKRLAASLVERVDVLLSEMERIAAKRQVSLAAVALNYVITAGEMRAAGEKPTIAIPIPGAKNAWQAQQNAQALGWRLDLDEMTKLRRAADQVDAKLPSIPLARESNRRGL
jgi:aryl-alcohol dehydrogenase-like predicted oxidoreductase